MNAITIDIETVPDEAFLFDEDARAIRYESIQIPANYKKEGTIERYRNDRMADDDAKGAICPLNGRIVGISWKQQLTEGTTTFVETDPAKERELLLKFYDSLPEFPCMVAGWRIRGFDLPFIELRTALHKLGSPCPWWPHPSHPHYRRRIFDLADHTQFYPGPAYKLEYWLKRFGLPAKLSSGRLVETMTPDDIYAYVSNDVEVESELITHFLPFLASETS